MGMEEPPRSQPLNPHLPVHSLPKTTRMKREGLPGIRDHIHTKTPLQEDGDILTSGVQSGVRV